VKTGTPSFTPSQRIKWCCLPSSEDEEEIVVAVVVVVADGARRTAIGEHLQDLRLVTLAEAPRRLHEAHAGARGDLVEADRGLRDSRGGRS